MFKHRAAALLLCTIGSTTSAAPGPVADGFGPALAVCALAPEGEDSDGDGLSDGEEVSAGTDPLEHTGDTGDTGDTGGSGDTADTWDRGDTDDTGDTGKADSLGCDAEDFGCATGGLGGTSALGLLAAVVVVARRRRAG